ncbi:hypothetical protein [Microbacterium sp.]|uniref:hypothetical protein n=1 Tax=Microbacterium sp. TaxID=51671 RepID=UPI0028123F83|nr:hypothetical protein [Microbacterium sp.]
MHAKTPDLEPTESPLLAEARLRAEMAQALAAAAPDGWARIRYECSTVGGVADISAVAELLDGSSVAADIPPGLSLVRRRLRAAMYQADRGTWFSMVLTVRRDGAAEATYNYDDEPSWHVDVADREWLTEQRKYPRSPDHRPDWLKRNLARAGLTDE